VAPAGGSPCDPTGPQNDKSAARIGRSGSFAILSTHIHHRVTLTLPPPPPHHQTNDEVAAQLKVCVAKASGFNEELSSELSDLTKQIQRLHEEARAL